MWYNISTIQIATTPKTMMKSKPDACINDTRILEVRPLTRADLALLALPAVKTDLVKGIRDSHHDVARLLVSGMTLQEVAAATGYSVNRISQLKGSPAFQELMALKREIIDDSWAASHDAAYATIQRVTRKAWRQVEEHLDEADETQEKLPLKTLLAVAADGSDRVGYMKKSATLNANIDFAKRLEEAIARSKQPKLIEGEAA